MRQILPLYVSTIIFRVLVLCTWLAECQRPMLEQWWFAVQVAVCGAGVILPKLKSRLPSKSSSVNMSLVINLKVTEGMNAAVSNACAYV